MRSGVGTQMLMVSSPATTGWVEGGPQAAVLVKLGDVRRRDILNVGFAAVDGVDLAAIQVDPRCAEPGASHFDGQGEADVTQADDADLGGAIFEFVEKRLSDFGERIWCECQHAGKTPPMLPHWLRRAGPSGVSVV